LLSEIRDAAVDGSSDLETLLRKCMVLAKRLKHEELAKWVSCELDGYLPGSLPVPEYRKFNAQCFGNFFGYGGSQARNVPIRESDIPNEYREFLASVTFGEGIGGLKGVLAGSEDGDLRIMWPGEAASIVRCTNVAPHLTLVEAWRHVNKSAIISVLSTVRNRILNFALEIESTHPDAGESTSGKLRVSNAEIDRAFQQHITQNFHGPVGAVASGPGIQQTATVNIHQRDFDSLASYLKENGLTESDISDLQTAIKEDPEPKSASKAFGEKVAGWIGKMLAKSAEGVWKVGTDTAAKLLTDAIKTHYGTH